jgi:hypothetical protein
MVEDGAVTSQPFVLGFDTELEMNGMLANIELGLRQRPGTATVDRLVPALMWPTVGFCVGALALMRRRRFSRD